MAIINYTTAYHDRGYQFNVSLLLAQCGWRLQLTRIVTLHNCCKLHLDWIIHESRDKLWRYVPHPAGLIVSEDVREIIIASL